MSIPTSNFAFLILFHTAALGAYKGDYQEDLHIGVGIHALTRLARGIWPSTPQFWVSGPGF